MKLGKDQKTTSFLSESCELKGNLQTKGGIRIDGRIDGTLTCESTIFVGEKGKIDADIVTKSIVSGGEIVGNITAEDTVQLNSPGSMEGEIKTCYLGIEKDVFFNGKCHLLSPRDNKRPVLNRPKIPRKAIPNRE